MTQSRHGVIKVFTDFQLLNKRDVIGATIVYKVLLPVILFITKGKKFATFEIPGYYCFLSNGENILTFDARIDDEN